MIKQLVFSIVSAFVLTTTLSLATNSGGIVNLYGYASAFGLCGTHRVIAAEPDAIIQFEEGNTFVIDKGHLRDKRLKALKKLTHEFCSH